MSGKIVSLVSSIFGQIAICAIVFSPLVVVCAGRVPTKMPDVACLRVGVRLDIHGVQPLVRRVYFGTRNRHGIRAADLDVLLISDHKTLRGENVVISILDIMMSDV